MKCQSLFSGKNKKNILNLSSAELAQRVVKINKELFFSALHIAAMYGQAKLIDILIQHGSLPDASDFLGCTPLHIASQKGYQNIIVSSVHLYFCLFKLLMKVKCDKMAHA